jgi:ethylmalonyl-CoA mutase
MPETPSPRLPEPDRPWMMRTYAGHSDARRSNELYRRNLAKGQTGLSVAFDLPTQTGYDPDHELARGEVGKVGVSIAHLGDMRTLLDGIPLEEMNTSMTINATAAWLLALYIVAAEEKGVGERQLQGTTQNDILKEYLSRGTYAFPPGPSMRLIADTIAYTVQHIPKWNPINICSYHLQEAGASPVQEIAYSMSNAIAVLDAVRERVGTADEARGQELMGSVFGRISFFVNAGVRFIEEHAKLRAMGALWDELGRERYGVADDRHRRFRYGVQVNSLGLTESQPENNVYRIALEALAVTLGRGARARAIQLPAWNEALGLPRPWDQQWSLRLQQILAYETDLLEYRDIFEGSKVMEGLVADLTGGVREEMQRVAELGGAVQAVDYMKAALVESHRERWRRIESGELTVVGMNRFESSESSPLTADADGGILLVDPQVEAEQREAVASWRESRDQAAVDVALAELARVAREHHENIMPATIAAARAGVTTGEWSQTLRESFGEYRAPTGVGEAAAVSSEEMAALRDEVERVSEALGRRLKFLVGKPGLDGHSNGAEQIAVRARDAGMDVVYEGIRLTPSQIATSAAQEGVHVIGLSILSGSHRELIPSVLKALRDGGVGDVPVVVGGIIPEADAAALREEGVAAVYTPKHWDLNAMMRDIVALVGDKPDDSGGARSGEGGRRAGGGQPDDSGGARSGEAGRRAGGGQPDDSGGARSGEAGRRAGGGPEGIESPAAA